MGSQGLSLVSEWAQTLDLNTDTVRSVLTLLSVGTQSKCRAFNYKLEHCKIAVSVYVCVLCALIHV